MRFEDPLQLRILMIDHNFAIAHIMNSVGQKLFVDQIQDHC